MSEKRNNELLKRLEPGLSKVKFDIISGVLRCDYDEVSSALRDNPDCINSVNDSGMTPLHISIAESNFGMAEYLMEQAGIDLMKLDNFDRRPIDLLGDFPNSEFRVSLLKAMYPERYKKYQNPESSLDL